jgi:Flp pilus assembly protein TadG
MFRRALASRERRGQTLVEFALILPVFLLLLMGILDLGRAVYYNSTLSNDARDTARDGIVDQTCANLTNAAKSRVGMPNVTVDIEWLNPSTGAVIGNCPLVGLETHAGVNDVMHVTVRYDYTAATPLIGNLVGTIHLKAESKFPVEATCVDDAIPANCPKGD